MELVKHETCQQYVKRRLSEGWGIVYQKGYHLILSSPDGNILRPVDLRNDVETLRPSAAGDETNNTPVGNSENWDCVDEAVADDNTTYVYTPSLGEIRDLYNLPASSGSGAINFIKVYFRVYEGSGSSSWAKAAIKSNSTTTEGAQKDIPGDTWTPFSEQWNTNPADSEAWEWSDIDSLQIGVTLKKGVVETRCTQVYVEVDYTPPAVGLENKSANMGAKMIAGKMI